MLFMIFENLKSFTNSDFYKNNIFNIWLIIHLIKIIRAL